MRLDPVWRQQPGPAGVGYMAFDPLDAREALQRGYVTVNGDRILCDLIGTDGLLVQNDGRVSVRLSFG